MSELERFACQQSIAERLATLQTLEGRRTLGKNSGVVEIAKNLKLEYRVIVRFGGDPLGTLNCCTDRREDFFAAEALLAPSLRRYELHNFVLNVDFTEFLRQF